MTVRHPQYQVQIQPFSSITKHQLSAQRQVVPSTCHSKLAILPWFLIILLYYYKVSVDTRYLSSKATKDISIKECIHTVILTCRSWIHDQVITHTL